jgi:hypothetical protein
MKYSKIGNSCKSPNPLSSWVQTSPGKSMWPGHRIFAGLNMVVTSRLRTRTWIRTLQAEHEKTHVLFGMEPTGHYWMPLAQFLRKQGIQVVLVNPMHVRKSKEVKNKCTRRSNFACTRRKNKSRSSTRQWVVVVLYSITF